jgi:hypothetical protein
MQEQSTAFVDERTRRSAILARVLNVMAITITRFSPPNCAKTLLTARNPGTAANDINAGSEGDAARELCSRVLRM